MKIKIIGTLMVVAMAFTTCEKDPETPEGENNFKEAALPGVSIISSNFL
jgi:hypothetical protein